MSVDQKTLFQQSLRLISNNRYELRSGEFVFLPTAMHSYQILQKLKNLFDSGMPSTFNIELIKDDLMRYQTALKEGNERNASAALDSLDKRVNDINQAKEAVSRGISGRSEMSFPSLEILEIYNEIVCEVEFKQREIEFKETKQSNENADDVNNR